MTGWTTAVVNDRVGHGQATCLIPPFLLSLIILSWASSLPNVYGIWIIKSFMYTVALTAVLPAMSSCFAREKTEV